MTLKRAGAIGLILLVALAFWLWTPDRSREELEARYLNSPTDLVDLGDFRLHVRDTGPKSAPTIILLHGFGSSLQTWDLWAGPLERTYRVVRLDLPGAGLSDPDPTGDYTDARTHALILKLMDKLDIKQAVFVGNSLGGRIAWTFTARHPDRVSKLVLIAPDGFASPGFAYGQKAEVPALLSIMSYVLPKALYRPNIDAAYANPKRLTDAVFDRYYDLTLAPGSRDALLARMQQTILVDPRPILPKITQPVLLLWGKKDALIPVANAQDYLKALPDARLTTFDTLGHVPHEEDARESIAPLLAFLEG
ncbi:MAG: alpha/beta fold hydrolase [Hyphomonadaceae bacterium]